MFIGIAILPGLANASEPTACAFGLLQCDEEGIVWGTEAVLGENMTAQLTGSDGLAEGIVKFGYFLRNVILPFLIFVGFFFFLFNLARYFIIDVGNEESRKKAKGNAVWGLAAFILISSLWGIVNLLTVPQIDRERSLCPDYLEQFCGNLGYDGVGGGYDGGSNLDFGNSSGGFGGGTTGGNGSGSANVSSSRLGELVFGNYREQVEFNFRSGAPRATSNTITIGANLSCAEGMQALQIAAGFESAIGGYQLYRSNGQLRWENITDSNGPYNIQYDADTINNASIAGAEDMHIIHLHPAATPAAAGLSMSGYAPTPADLTAVCANVGSDPVHVVVDDTNVWTVAGNSLTCPRRAQEEDDLFVISILLQLGILEATARNTEFNALYNWDELPSSVRRDLRDYTNTDFNSLTSAEIIALADDIARSGDMSITRTTIDSFCSGL